MSSDRPRANALPETMARGRAAAFALALAGLTAPTGAQEQQASAQNPSQAVTEVEQICSAFKAGAIEQALSGVYYRRAAMAVAKLGTQAEPALREVVAALRGEGLRQATASNPDLNARDIANQRVQILRGLRYVVQERARLGQPFASEDLSAELLTTAIGLATDREGDPRVVSFAANLLTFLRGDEATVRRAVTPLVLNLNRYVQAEKDFQQRDATGEADQADIEAAKMNRVSALTLIGTLSNLGRHAYPNVAFLRQVAEQEVTPEFTSRALRGVGMLGQFAPRDNLRVQHHAFLVERLPSAARLYNEELVIAEGAIEGLGALGAISAPQAERIGAILLSELSRGEKETSPLCSAAVGALTRIYHALESGSAERDGIREVLQQVSEQGDKDFQDFVQGCMSRIGI